MRAPRTYVVPMVLLALLSCSRAEKPRSMAKVRMNVSPMLKFGAFSIAKEEGFFAAEGIDPQFVEIDQASGLLAATSGDLDVFTGPVRSGLFNAMLRGSSLRIVADNGHFEPMPCSPESFLAPAPMADRIAANGGSLRGERVAIIPGGVTEYVIEKLLEKNGLTKADVELAQVPQGDFLSRANRKMDAVSYTTEPKLSQALADGSMKVIATSQDVAPGHQHSVVTFGRRLLHDDPELGRRVMRAYLRGVRRYNEGKSERNVAILARHSKLPPAVIRATCWLPIAGDGEIRDEDIQPILDWFLARGYLEAPIARSVWWNGNFIKP
ncbi:MAG: ABC transporter substrate-binding protein [Acidobacteriota bacterium]